MSGAKVKHTKRWLANTTPGTLLHIYSVSAGCPSSLREFRPQTYT